MDMFDRPIQTIDVEKANNCLFQSLAYYLAGSEKEYQILRDCIIGFEIEHPDEFIAIKDWTNESWTAHVEMLAETGVGTDMELYAFAAMFGIDVWVFQKDQWTCYRPMFEIFGDECKSKPMYASWLASLHKLDKET
uniref:OTU domain-containing protein n=1 Tax=Elaeophora elaphi TaxID=1147741 RepID=A0A0R3RKC7_9BILA